MVLSSRGRGYFSTRSTSGLISSYCRILFNIIDTWPQRRTRNKKTGDRHLKTKHSLKSKPPQLYLLEQWNIQTSLDDFGKPILSFKKQLWTRIRTYTTNPWSVANPSSTGISWPYSSLAFVTLNIERTDEETMKIVASTKWRPGQILLPLPNTNESAGSSRTLPSSSRKRSGLNSSGSGYISGSCRIALEHLR